MSAPKSRYTISKRGPKQWMTLTVGSHGSLVEGPIFVTRREAKAYAEAGDAAWQTHEANNKWYATRQTDRTRKMVTVTISDDARSALRAAADREGVSASAMVERLVMSYAHAAK